MEGNMKSIRILVALAMLLGTAVSFADNHAAAGSDIPHIDASTAAAMLADDTQTLLIDARPRAAYYYLGHPKNAFSIPARFWLGRLNADGTNYAFSGNRKFAEDVGTVVKQKDRHLIIVASNTAAGIKAAQRLTSAGFTNVHNLKGGFPAWVEAGQPVIRKANPVRIFFRADTTD
jgi:rhodanese-related sulfurtransferase